MLRHWIEDGASASRQIEFDSARVPIMDRQTSQWQCKISQLFNGSCFETRAFLFYHAYCSLLSVYA